MTKVLRAENLVKKYGDFYAVNDIDLNLNKGEVVGLLGPNGAGKTTTFYMIAGLVHADNGKISVARINSAITLREVFIMSTRWVLLKSLTLTRINN